MIFKPLSNQRCRTTATTQAIYAVLLSTLFLFFYWNKYYEATFLKLNYPTQILKDKWILLENNVTVFSAFYDDRVFRPNPVLVVLGLERQSDRSTRYECIISYTDGRKVTLRDSSPLQVLTRVHWTDGVDKRGVKIWNHRPFQHLCVLPTPEIPERVTIASSRARSKKFPHFENLTEKVINYEKFTLVTNRKEIKRRFSFGVCISSPIFKIDDSQELVDTFEMNRLLGAEFFTVYIYQVSGKPVEILTKYAKDSLAEVVANWGTNFPGEAHYYGQLLSVTDCLYRNIYRVKYLVYTDLDEVIIPLRHPCWGSLMNELDGPSKGSFNFEMVNLREAQGADAEKHKVNCPSGVEISLKSSRYATFRNRSVAVGFTSRRTKYITKTNVTLIAQIHYAEKLVKDFTKVDVPVEIALLYHYRIPYLTSRHIKGAWVMETVVAKYVRRLLTAVKHFMCRLS